ncbi:unnamed protein product, partial [Discosporangium mesarthrocarpum]
AGTGGIDLEETSTMSHISYASHVSHHSVESARSNSWSGSVMGGLGLVDYPAGIPAKQWGRLQDRTVRWLMRGDTIQRNQGPRKGGSLGAGAFQGGPGGGPEGSGGPSSSGGPGSVGGSSRGPLKPPALSSLALVTGPSDAQSATSAGSGSTANGGRPFSSASSPPPTLVSPLYSPTTSGKGAATAGGGGREDDGVHAKWLAQLEVVSSKNIED